MISAKYYQLVYLLIVLIFSLRYFGHSKSVDNTISEKIDTKGLLIMFFFVLFIGLRPADDIFVDMMYYHKILNSGMADFEFSYLVENLLFDNLLVWWSHLQIGSSLFFLFIATIYYGGIYIACRKIFPQNLIIAFLVFAGAFSTFSYGTNGIKAGAAASLFLIALAYHDNIKIWLPMLLLSWGFHHSMSMPVMAYVVTIFVKKPKFYFYFWFFCLVMAAAHITVFQELFAGYTNEKAASYLTSTGEDWTGKSGFRLDFILYSSVPVLIGWISKFRLHLNNPQYDKILSMYLLCNGLWMLCMYINYSNRVAYLSWFMYPAVLLLPTFNPIWGNSGYIKPKTVAYLHFYFTLFMFFIYYGLH